MPLNFPMFLAALEICGVLQPIARDQIYAQGYKNVVQFASTLSKSNIGDIVKAMNKLPEVRVPHQPALGDDSNADPGFDMVKVNIPFALIHKLKALCKWVRETQLIGKEFEGDDKQVFTLNELVRMLEQMDFKKQVATNKPKPPALPDKFEGFGMKWRSFIEGLESHLCIVQGCFNIPLICVIHKHLVPMEEDKEKFYDNSNMCLIALVQLEGDKYRQDNSRVWDILHPLVYGTPAWRNIKQYNKDHDGLHGNSCAQASWQRLCPA
jgi:hypothetical protein